VKPDEASRDIVVGALTPVKCMWENHTHHSGMGAHCYVATSTTRRNTEEHVVFMEQILMVLDKVS